MNSINAYPISKLQWQVGHSGSPNEKPEVFVPAAVPGAVQLDWAAAEGWEPYYAGDNSDQYRWMEDCCWTYKSVLDFVPPAKDERLFFVCKGVDYECEIRLNGTVLHYQEGMFTPIELDLTGCAKPGDLLEVIVYPAPKSMPSPDIRDQANQSCKPAVSYGWDFHPRLIPLGIWDETGLQIRPAVHISDFETFYKLTPDFSKANMSVKVNIDQLTSVDCDHPNPAGTNQIANDSNSMKAGQTCAGSNQCLTTGSLVWSLHAPDGNKVLTQTIALNNKTVPAGTCSEYSLTAVLENPLLWQPNGFGEQWLYTSELVLELDGSAPQTYSQRVGFRRIRLVMQPDAWKEPSTFPKTRSTPPITLEVNGRRIFGKGSNWVSPDIFPGKIDHETCAGLLKLVKDAHMNLLRCWGGAPVQKDFFFDMCDELGIMVWQEFPLACNRYEGTDKYLKILDQESRAIIKRLRRHPSLTLWCGGNELFNEWSGMTDQDAAIRLMNSNTFKLDPDRPFLPTAPVMGMGHGSYSFVQDGVEVFQRFAKAGFTAYTEFGVLAHSSVETLRRILPEAEQRPDLPPETYKTERAREGWSNGRTYNSRYYFSAPTTMEQVVETTQFLQGEGLKFIFEEARRQKPHCSMALNWCLNEPWPTVSNCSIVTWPVEIRPAYYEVANALRPVLASARVPKFTWSEGEVFTAELWLLSDCLEAVAPGRIEASLVVDGEEIFLLAWDHPGTSADTNLLGPVVQYKPPKKAPCRMTLVLKDVSGSGYDSKYTFLYGDMKTYV